ncbi:MAG: PEP-CTERM sorting domain-containing protein [Opitutales bacterium]|nr:PEP-CTERM sorting domain-containing protein [Opitutales bacterium]
MKNTLLITTLLAASSIGAMAELPATAQLNLFAGGSHEKLNTNPYNKGWTYSSPLESNYGSRGDGGWGGNFPLDGVHNASANPLNLTHHRQNTSFDLTKDARYEFGFTFSLNQAGASVGDQAMAGMYLAGNKGSIFFGNAQLNSYSDRREAVLVKYNVDIAEYNDNAGQDVYFPNEEFSYKIQSPYDYTSPVNGKWFTVFDGANNAFDSGEYRLEIVVESFSDSAQKDMLYLYAKTPEGTRYGWYDLTELGFDNNAYFDAYGFVLHNDGASIATAEKISGYEYSRTLKQVQPEVPPTPPVVPDIPEPSAFGLLAGVGALALVASRRRRSRS